MARRVPGSIWYGANRRVRRRSDGGAGLELTRGTTACRAPDLIWRGARLGVKMLSGGGAVWGKARKGGWCRPLLTTSWPGGARRRKRAGGAEVGVMMTG